MTTSMPKICVTVLACWLMAVHTTHGGWSKNILNVVATINGDYDNSDQIERDKGHDFIQFRVIPVMVSALPENAVIYVEWACNGDIITMELGELVDGNNGDVFLTLYNFTDFSQYKYGTFNIDALSTLKRENLQSVSGCTAAYKPVGNNTFVGSWAECRHKINGSFDVYQDYFTCDCFRSVVPVMAIEMTSSVQYEFKRKGDKYPLIGAPGDYVNPCNQTVTKGAAC